MVSVQGTLTEHGQKATSHIIGDVVNSFLLGNKWHLIWLHYLPQNESETFSRVWLLLDSGEQGIPYVYLLKPLSLFIGRTVFMIFLQNNCFSELGIPKPWKYSWFSTYKGCIVLANMAARLGLSVHFSWRMQLLGWKLTTVHTLRNAQLCYSLEKDKYALLSGDINFSPSNRPRPRGAGLHCTSRFLNLPLNTYHIWKDKVRWYKTCWCQESDIICV